MLSIMGVGIFLSALLWTLLITALIGHVIASSRYASGASTASVNFTMFVAAWSWVVSLFGLAASFVSSLAVPLVLLPLFGLTVLFTFIDAVLLSAKIGSPNCSRTLHRGANWIAYGSGDTERRCREIQASTAFMWFLWATFIAATVYAVRLWRSKPSSGSSKPNMSQMHV